MDEAGSVGLSKDDEDVWSVTIPEHAIAGDYHTTGTVYYGYRLGYHLDCVVSCLECGAPTVREIEGEEEDVVSMHAMLVAV